MYVKRARIALYTSSSTQTCLNIHVPGKDATDRPRSAKKDKQKAKEDKAKKEREKEDKKKEKKDGT